MGRTGSPSRSARRAASTGDRRDPERSELIWTWLVNRGILTTPGREQEWNVTVAHDEAAVDRYVDVFGELASEL